MRLDPSNLKYRLVGSLINLRSRLTRVATGEQGIFVRRTVFEEMGGFPEIPLMEDIAFSRMLKKKGKVACLMSQVVTSSRRWDNRSRSGPPHDAANVVDGKRVVIRKSHRHGISQGSAGPPDNDGRDFHGFLSRARSMSSMTAACPKSHAT